MLLDCIKKLLLDQDLTISELEDVVAEILTGDNPEQIAAFLVLLKKKGETAADVEVLVRHMQQKMRSIEIATPVLDIVGTGGDGHNTVNISTAAAILAASCGVNVVKHGGRAGSSLAGSADLMEAFGYHLELTDDKIIALVANYHFAFCSAPSFHKSFAATKVIRKKLGVPTIFNLLGPLLNPAKAEYVMLGVADPKYMQIMAQALQKLGVTKALVFHCAGLDEVCTVGVVDIIEVNSNKSELDEYKLNPADYGFKKSSIEDLRGGTAIQNKEIITEVFQGSNSAIADTIVLNAGLACYLYGVAETIEQGIELAKAKQASGAAYKLLTDIVAFSAS